LRCKNGISAFRHDGDYGDLHTCAGKVIRRCRDGREGIGCIVNTDSILMTFGETVRIDASGIMLPIYDKRKENGKR